MNKIAIVAATVDALGLSSVAAPSPAEARIRRFRAGSRGRPLIGGLTSSAYGCRSGPGYYGAGYYGGP
jgi:hypothetical protein